MKKRNIILILALLVILVGCAAEVQKEDALKDDAQLQIADANEPMNYETVTYGDSFSGYLVKPLKEGAYPGVIMIHEWWGLNQNIKNMAHDLAEEGYNVLAIDLFDGKVADNADDARAYSSEVRDDTARAIEHMKSAAQYLREEGTGSVASMGWCFGGGMSMQLALNEEMDATIIYYGTVETDKEALSSISWPVLGIFGDADTVVPIESVKTFDNALDELGVENEINVYPGLGHAFANPSNPRHDKEAAEDAWRKTIIFLNKNLK